MHIFPIRLFVQMKLWASLNNKHHSCWVFLKLNLNKPTSQPNRSFLFFIFCCALFYPLEILCKWHLLQARRPSVPDDRRRRPSQSSLDAVRHLAHLCWQTGSTLSDAGTPLLWEKSPDPVRLVFLWTSSVALWLSAEISDNVEAMADNLQEVNLSLISG